MKTERTLYVTLAQAAENVRLAPALRPVQSYLPPLIGAALRATSRLRSVSSLRSVRKRSSSRSPRLRSSHRPPATLRATTMAELLVVMVLSGIVFLSVMDGLGIFRRYAAKMAGRIEEAGRFYGDFMRLDGLMSDCDSALLTDESVVEVYRNGIKCASLARADSALLVFMGPQPDTLLRGVTAMDCATAQSKKTGGGTAPLREDGTAPVRIDTMSVAFATAEGIVTRVRFPTTQLPVEEKREQIEEKEEQYKYE